MAVSLSLLVFVVCVCALVFVFRTLLVMYHLRHIPTLPGALPIVGHLHHTLGSYQDLWEYIKRCSLNVNKQGGVSKLWLGPQPCIAVTDPEVALRLMNTCLDKYYVYKFGEDWLGDGLVTSSGDTWRRHRRLLTPSFHRQVLNGFLPVFNAQAAELAECLASRAEGPPFEHWPLLALNALETICQTALGVQYASATPESAQYASALESFLETMVRRVMRPWLHLGALYRCSGLRRDEVAAVKVLQAVSDSVLSKSKQTAKKDVEQQRFKAFYQLLEELSSSGELTAREVREEVDTIIAAGHDTSSSALMYLLLLIGQHDRVQRKIYEEITEVFGESSRDVTREDLPRLVYMEAAVKEALRVYPTVPLVGRVTNHDTHIYGRRVPVGIPIFLSIWGIHRNLGWGADAGLFLPERWLTSSAASAPAPAAPSSAAMFAAFSIGKRACIGKTYAMMLIKTSLVHVLRRCRIHAAPIDRADPIDPAAPIDRSPPIDPAAPDELPLKWGFVLKPVHTQTISTQLR